MDSSLGVESIQGKLKGENKQTNKKTFWGSIGNLGVSFVKNIHANERHEVCSLGLRFNSMSLKHFTCKSRFSSSGVYFTTF